MQSDPRHWQHREEQAAPAAPSSATAKILRCSSLSGSECLFEKCGNLSLPFEVIPYGGEIGIYIVAALPTVSDTICCCRVMGNKKVSASEIRDGGSGRAEGWKDVKPVYIKLTVLLGKGVDCEVRENTLSDCL